MTFFIVEGPTWEFTTLKISYIIMINSGFFSVLAKPLFHQFVLVSEDEDSSTSQETV